MKDMLEEEKQKYIQKLAEEVVKKMEHPHFISRLISLLKRHDSTADEIVNELLKDPVLVAQTLRLANTILGHMQEIKSIRQAVVILGTKQILHLALGVWAAKIQKLESKFFGTEKGEIAKFSVFGAVASVEFANIAGLGFIQDTVFAASAMRTIGRVAIDVVLKDRATFTFDRVLRKIAIEKKTFTDSLKDVLGYDYNELGAEILKRWNLPEEFYLTTKYYIKPSLYKEGDKSIQKIIACVHMGDLVARMIGEASPRDSFLEIFDKSAPQILEIDDAMEIIEKVADKVLSQRENILEIFRLREE